MLPRASACKLSLWLPQSLCSANFFAEFVKQAVEEDNAQNYQKAFELYKTAIEYFCTHLKYEKNAKAREAITAKVSGAWLGQGLVVEAATRGLTCACAGKF